MLTEYHCHILPEIDDGSESAEMSLSMVEIMHSQGVERIAATPHFYAHKERSVESYLKKRKEALSKISGKTAVSNIRLGAEIAIEHGISELKDIEKLAIQGTNLILLELPYRGYSEWMSEEIYNISAEYKLKVILAHIHRYLEYYTKDEMENILRTNAIFQINIEAFDNWKEKKLVKQLIRDEYKIIFGSDAHNLTSRRPNWDLLRKKCKPEIIEASNRIFDKYSK